MGKCLVFSYISGKMSILAQFQNNELSNRPFSHSIFTNCYVLVILGAFNHRVTEFCRAVLNITYACQMINHVYKLWGLKLFGIFNPNFSGCANEQHTANR